MMTLDYFTALNKATLQDKNSDLQRGGIWFIHGDEPLLQQNLLAALRQGWHNNPDIERERVDLSNAADWSYALSLLNNQSLFAATTALEVHGNYKADGGDLAKLEAFANNPAGNILIICFAKQDKKAQTTKFFQTLATCATIVELTITDERQRQQILSEEAKKYGLALNQIAWKELLDNTQNNLFAASQALLRLSFSHADVGEITPDHLKMVLVDQSRFSVYDLADAALAGQAEKAVSILKHLQESGEQPTQLLWALAKEARLVLQLAHEPQAFAANCRALFIWQSRQVLYQRAMQRVVQQAAKPKHQSVQVISQSWISLILQIDQSIKGVGHQQPWDLLLQLTLHLAGITLFDSLQASEVALVQAVV